MKIQHLFVLLIVFLPLFTEAQDIIDVTESARRIGYLDIANNLHKNADYYEAIAYYEKARKQRTHKDNVELLSHLAECYRLARKYSKAAEAYGQLAEKAPNEYPLSFFWKAKMHHANENYTKALETYRGFLSNSNTKIKTYEKLAKNGIKGCKRALKENTRPYHTIDDLVFEGIEKPSYYGAYYHDSLLWLTSSVKIDRPLKVELSEIKGLYDTYYIDRLYYIKHTSSGEWKKGKTVENMFYTMSNNYLPPSFSPDGSKLFVSICEKTKDPFCEIKYSPYRSGGEISLKSLKKPINDQEQVDFSSKDPTVFNMYNKQWMIFSSNRKKGAGGYDLYVCELDSNLQTSRVSPLGKSINSPLDEISPHYDKKNRTLFFSSNGLPGYGSFDVFSVKGDPLKGWGDVENLGVSINTGNDEYYYYHEEMNGSFMGFVSSNRGQNQCCDQVYEVSRITYSYDLTVRVFDARTKKPLNNAIIKIREKNVPKAILDSQLVDTSIITTTLNQDQSYSVKVHKKDYDTADFRLSLQRSDTTVDVYLNRQVVYLTGVVTSKETNDTLDSPKMVFIDPDQNVQDSITPPDGNYKIKIPENRWDRVEINKKGFMFYTEDLNIKDEEVRKGNVVRNFALEKIKVGAKVAFQNIEFEFDKSRLKKSSYPLLNRIYQFFKNNPGVHMEVSGHTDSIGSYEYNLHLSRRRVESVVDFLVNKGVDPSRMKTKAYSFSKPIATNKTKEGRAKNRRVEFEVLKKKGSED